MMDMKTFDKIEKMCNIQDKLISVVEMELANGCENVDTHELYEVVDIIKDLSEAKKYCLEAEYYESVVMAMASGEEEPTEQAGRSGYNPMPKPYVSQEPYVENYMRNKPMMQRPMQERQNDLAYRMGYSRNNSMSANGSVSNVGEQGMQTDVGNGRYGKAYEDYQYARRYYNQTHSVEDKQAMTEHANEHISDTVNTMRNIWAEADPEMRKRMKTDIQGLLNEMKE